MAESSTINIEEIQRAPSSQSNQNINAIAVDIVKQLGRVPPASSDSYIFRVHHQLRMVNEKAYEPVLISIGPYHSRKRVNSLQYMEEHKLRYLNQLTEEVEREIGISKAEQLNNYLVALKELEDKARAYYAEAVTLDQYEFLTMMLLDGCFIVQLFKRFRKSFFENANEVDLLLSRDWILDTLARDLILIENQLPFFVLEKLHTMISKQPDPLILIISAVAFLPIYSHLPRDQGSVEMCIALQSISMQCATPYFKRPICTESKELDVEKLRDIKHLLDLVHKFMFIEETLVRKHETDQGVEEPTYAFDMLQMNYKYSATELRDLGVKLRAIQKGKFYDIIFKDGVLEIPMIKIEGETEILFRNLIAYEQHTHGGNVRYITDYACFMDDLIESRKDVQLFRRRQIINSMMGDDEVISAMFNRMLNNVIISSAFHYEKTFRKMDEYSRKHRHRKTRHMWMTSLKRNYLSTPWKILSIIAASILLIVALLQTVYTTLSYYYKQ